MDKEHRGIDYWRNRYSEKFLHENAIFSRVRKGAKIFIGTACGEPRYLIDALVRYVEEHPKAVADAELMQVFTLGVAPWKDQKFGNNFRYNSFFIGDHARDSINAGFGDYTPVFLSRVPELLKRGQIEIDVALFQVSMPDKNGYVSLGVSVDITKSAIESAGIRIAQINPQMPRVHGDTFIKLSEIDYAVFKDEPITEVSYKVPDEVARKVGKYVARIINDGDTIQIGYGSLPNAILGNLQDKKHLGIHSELLSDSMVGLMRYGAIDNSRKTIDRGKTIASFCMGSRSTYEFIDDNPGIEFREISYTNNPMVLAQIDNMTAVNASLQVDLTGQSTSESIGSQFYSGIGGHADFMRGANLSRGGKTILVLESTARNGKVSRIVPFLDSGAGVTLNRGDINYIVTEYGIANIHGRNIRQRAMDIIAIAHPRFRAQLIEQAKKHNLIYQDQAFIPGKRGVYPEHLETTRESVAGILLHFRPVRINDDPLLKDFFYSLSDQSFQRRFMSQRRDMPHSRRQEFVVIDYTKELNILACVKENDVERVVAMGQIIKNDETEMGEVAFAVLDEFHNMEIGTEMLRYLTEIAISDGLLGFTAEVLRENRPMLRVFEKLQLDMDRKLSEDIYEIVIRFEKVTQTG